MIVSLEETIENTPVLLSLRGKTVWDSVHQLICVATYRVELTVDSCGIGLSFNRENFQAFALHSILSASNILTAAEVLQNGYFLKNLEMKKKLGISKKRFRDA